MKRIRLWCAVMAAVLIGCGVAGYALRFPARSAFLTRAEPGACALISDRTPFGAVTSCELLGRRTPPFGDPDGSVFVLLATTSGPAAVRIDYRNTGGSGQFTAEAVEIPGSQAPGLSGDTVDQLKKAIEGRGGLHAGWKTAA